MPMPKGKPPDHAAKYVALGFAGRTLIRKFGFSPKFRKQAGFTIMSQPFGDGSQPRQIT
jgi:hypothetical protein